MILSTSVIKKTKKVYVAIILICIVFDIIYEQFSYGEYSNFMRFMFVVPLIGIIPYILKLKISRISYNLWNSTIAIFISGCLIKSIINISGRYCNYDYIYLGVGCLYLFMSLISFMRTKNTNFTKI